MKNTLLYIVTILLLNLRPALAVPCVHHNMDVMIDPGRHWIEVRDTISWEGEPDLCFFIDKGLAIVGVSKGYHVEKDVSIKEPDESHINAQCYRLISLDSNGMIKRHEIMIHYRGEICYPLKQGEEYERSFQETPGWIGPEGLYLASQWFPQTKDALFTFRIAVEAPGPWHIISQGQRIKREPKSDKTLTVWDCPHQMDEIYLVGGPLFEYTRMFDGGLEAFIFLRTEDTNLASKYLGVTGDYIFMYQKMLGPYPYKKFALVENFWETGYGMPSFTLLGPKVIRLPFIIRTSYPHEILHNWWGNGVFVDYEKGNWCEGLTAYLADHLMKEAEGASAEYRRQVLQKYRDFVRSSKDFPLTLFRSRLSQVTEAVGYGKALMLYHTLRMRLGDSVFLEALSAFYNEFLFKKATFKDVCKTFEKVSKQELSRLFREQVEETGAPSLGIHSVTLTQDQGKWNFSFTLRQNGTTTPYQLYVPVVITLEHEAKAYIKMVDMKDSENSVSLSLDKKPVRIDVDPEFDLFRKLDRSEIPSSVGQIFGAEKLLIVIPGEASSDLKLAYQNLAEKWSNREREVVMDTTLNKLPSDRSVFLFGNENHFKGLFIQSIKNYPVNLTEDSLEIEGKHLTKKDHTWVLTARCPENPELAIGWLATNRAAALPGISTKLPHYGKYSFLGFEGDEPVNMLKGQWPVQDSPLTYFLGSTSTPCGETTKRKPLGTIPTPVSIEGLLSHIKILASPEFKGRGLGTNELDKAAEYIADHFKKIGLEPCGDNNTYFQRWTAKAGPDGQEIDLCNVIGFIPGTRKEWAKQSIVIGAHYDHLGTGWPDVKKGYEGQIHPGADDNASGVAALIELARLIKQESNPSRAIIFVAFTGEESGRLGSRYFVSNFKNYSPEQITAMINLDTVGRLFNNDLLILRSDSAREWIHIFRGAGFLTGVKVDTVKENLDASDNVSFIEKGIPAVQLFSGPHTDYHTPGDTPDKIDGAGLIKIIKLLKESLGYLTEKESPLTSSLSTQSAERVSTKKRRAMTGIIPDFSFKGTGIMVSGVTPDSPASIAGLKKGDILLKIGGVSLNSLKDLSEFLKDHEPGEKVQVTYKRDGEINNVELTLSPR